MNLTIKSIYDLQIKSFKKMRRLWLIILLVNLTFFSAPLFNRFIYHALPMSPFGSFWWGVQVGTIILSLVELIGASVDLKLCYDLYNMDMQFSASQEYKSYQRSSIGSLFS